MNENTSSTYSKDRKDEMIKDVSIGYSHLFNPSTVAKVLISFSKKEIVTLLLKQFGLYQEYKVGKLKISYQRKDDTHVNYYQTKDSIVYHIFVGGCSGDDILENEFYKNKFIFSIAHELSHVRYDIDNYYLKDFELAVDFLALTLGYTRCLYELAKTLDQEHNTHIGYICVKEMPSILNRIEERRKIIYL